MLDSLQFIRRYKPACGIIENVERFAHTDAVGELSPHDVVVKELETLNYAVSTHHLCLSSFHTAVRQRHLAALAALLQSSDSSYLHSPALSKKSRQAHF